MSDKTMIYFPNGVRPDSYSNLYHSDGVTYYAKVIDFDDWPEYEKKGWCRHFTDFKKAKPKAVKKVVKKAAKKKAK